MLIPIQANLPINPNIQWRPPQGIRVLQHLIQDFVKLLKEHGLVWTVYFSLTHSAQDVLNIISTSITEHLGGLGITLTLPDSSQGARGWYVARSNQKPTKKRNSNLREPRHYELLAAGNAVNFFAPGELQKYTEKTRSEHGFDIHTLFLSKVH